MKLSRIFNAISVDFTVLFSFFSDFSFSFFFFTRIQLKFIYLDTYFIREMKIERTESVDKNYGVLGKSVCLIYQISLSRFKRSET